MTPWTLAAIAVGLTAVFALATIGVACLVASWIAHRVALATTSAVLNALCADAEAQPQDPTELKSGAIH